MTITETGETFVRVFSSRGRRQVARGTLLDIEGTLSIGTHTFDLGACVGVDYRSKLLRNAPSGPKPGGKVPTNDLPSGAKQLAVGGSAVAQTKGASPDREAPFDCLIFEDETGAPFEVPVANTVWYKFTGTGKSVTIDTAGSDFDTVLATYTAGPGGTFTPVPVVVTTTSPRRRSGARSRRPSRSRPSPARPTTSRSVGSPTRRSRSGTCGSASADPSDAGARPRPSPPPGVASLSSTRHTQVVSCRHA